MRFILSILFSLFMCAPSLAVIQSQNSRNDYIGTGLVTVYPYTFKIFNQNELVVTKRSILGVETVLSIGTDYTVSGVNNKNGGNVTLNVALPSGEGLVIRRVVDIEQNADIRNQGAYYPDYIEKAMDSLVMNDQTIKEQVDRSLKLAVTTNPATFSPTLPTLMTPESVLVTKVDGTGFEIIPRSAFKGDQGDKGDTGEFTSFQVVGELEYTDPTPMSVTNVGTTTDAQLEFVLRKGPKGDPGTTSYAIYTEITNPTGADGNDGDIWINTVTGDLFQKELGVWNFQGNIQGPTGPAGGVDSFNTRQGAVVSVAGDYDADQIVYDNTVSGLTAVEVQAAIDEVKSISDGTVLRLKRATSTGVLSGLDLSVNVDTSKFNIAAGLYEIADMTDINNPVITQVNYAGSTANAVTNITTQDVTYILLSSSGSIIQQATYPTPSQRRQYAFVGRLNHSNRTSITFVNTFPDYKISPVASFYDLLDAIAPFKIDDGLMITANGANLSMNRSAGKVFFRSENYLTDKTNPHMKSYNSQTLQPFRKMTQTATPDVADVTVLDPANYDNAGSVTAIGGGTSRSTIQRVYLYKSGAVRVAYGQTIYNTFADATSAVGKEMFVVNPTVEQSAVLVALIVLRRNCTSLQDASCSLIVPASRFGGTGGGGGSGASDLQGAYVSSTQPQITLNSTQLGLQVRDASTPIGSTLFAIQNNAGSTSYLGVDVNGISVSNFVGSGTTGAVRVHNLTTTQKNALTPAAGMIVYDTTLARFECYTTSWAACGSSDIQNSDLTLTASDTLAISLTSDRQTWLVQGGASAVDMSTTPFGSSAPANGAEITLIGNDDTFVVFFPSNDAAKGIIGNSFTLSRGQVVTVKYNATLDRYVIKSTSN